MGTLCDAAFGRKFAPRWQIVLLNGSSVMDSIRTIFACFYSFSAIFRFFPLLGCQAHQNGDVVYASLIHRRVGREARLIRRIAYTTIG